MAVAVRDQFARLNSGKLAQQLICSQESVLHICTNPLRNWTGDGHFTVVCLAENLQALVVITVIR